MNMHIAGIRLPTPDEIDREFVQKISTAQSE